MGNDWQGGWAAGGALLILLAALGLGLQTACHRPPKKPVATIK